MNKEECGLKWLWFISRR